MSRLDEIDTTSGQLVVSARSLEQYGCSGEYTDERTIAAVRADTETRRGAS